ncbi:DUF6428 family protein [Aestuariivirga sp.]|uniref:DUF6428 family protein n=1 Tax=Aestuariivirga sp. TaxID=2650926 RepID=UPI00391B6487
MTVNTSPITLDFHGDASVATLLGALRGTGERALVIEYGGHTIRPGYHVTEVKAGTFVTLDCGGNPDSWSETILQVEDLGPEDAQDFMSVRKFCGIMEKVAEKVALDPTGRLTLEVGPPGAAMQVFDVGSLSIDPDRVVLRLAARAAICKPRHRTTAPARTAQCRSGETLKSKCC